jgi:hypothetical protein
MGINNVELKPVPRLLAWWNIDQLNIFERLTLSKNYDAN